MFAKPVAINISNWLFFVCFLIFSMVVVGGITRLTESGLSMVNWHPIMGAIPPLSEAAWLREFADYQQSPQYKLTNSGMTLAAFKGIYWWEWGHRLLGRLIGLVFFIPLVWFWMRKQIPKGFKGRLLFLLLLGAAQGFLGWYMVQSGLIDEPRVSHLRLTAHLSLALFILGLAYWTALELRPTVHTHSTKLIKRLTHLLALLVVLQLLLGGLVAGLKAGYIYNTWPLMGDGFVPTYLFDIEPWYVSLINSATTTQFFHRMTAYLIACLVILLWVIVMRAKASPHIKRATFLLVVCIAGQIFIGVVMLLKEIPVVWGAAHQAGGVIVLMVLLRLMHLQTHR